jgi:caffeoyl-CoA O-methyltransferase
MSVDTLTLTPALLNYLREHSVKESDGLKQLRLETHAQCNVPEMQISQEQGQFFQVLLKAIQAKKVLEIGTFTGYSSICFALAIPDDGQVVCCDSSTEWTNIAQKYWQRMGLSHKMTLHVAPALKTLAELVKSEAGSFDFAFIDADKLNYQHYYEYCLNLVRPGGVIAIDNVLWGGDVADPNNQKENTATIRTLNKQIVEDDRVTACMIPIGDGLTLAYRL